MWIFYFIGFLCFLTLPLLVSFMAGQFFLGSAQWVSRIVTRNRDAKRLMASTQSDSTAVVTFQQSGKQLLDQVLMTRQTMFTYDSALDAHGLSVMVRTQSMIVDERGQRVGFPWSREERKRSAHVQAVSLIVDTRGIVPVTTALFVDARADEVSFGDESLFRAMVDGGLRSALGPGDQLSITDGCVLVQSPFAARDGRLPKLIDRLAAACRRLVDSFSDGRPDIAGLLLENVEHDLVTDVRARSIDALLDLLPEGPKREHAYQVALDDRAAEVRLAAARRMGDRGFDVALAVVRDAEASEGLRQRALRFLMRRFHVERITPVLEACLDDDSERLRQVAIRHLGALQYKPAVPLLAALTATTDPQTALDLANALGAIGAEGAELALITLYEKNFDDVKVAAADALGSIGTFAAVGHLLPAAESTRVSQPLRIAASTAVKLIQSRLRNGSAGALSVLELREASGQLSLGTGGRGALSAAPEE